MFWIYEKCIEVIHNPKLCSIFIAKILEALGETGIVNVSEDLLKSTLNYFLKKLKNVIEGKESLDSVLIGVKNYVKTYLAPKINV